MRERTDCLYLAAFLLIEFCTYLMTMNYVFRIPFRREKRRWILCVLLLVIVHAGTAWFGNLDLSTGLSVVTLGAASLVLLKEKKRRVITLHLTAYLAYSAFAGMVITLLGYVSKAAEQELLDSNWIPLLVDCIPVCVLPVYHYCSKKDVKEFRFTLQTQQIVFMLAGAAGIYLVEGSVQIMGRSIEQDPFLNATRMIITVVCFLSLGLIVWQGVVVNRQNQMAEHIRLNELFNRMTEEHFKEILAGDEAMRRFRHDYRAHMIALKGYSERGEQKELTAYLERLLQAGDTMTARTYMGDAGVDAVINHLAERARQEDITMTIEGGGRRPERVTSFEMCCVFSNILTNAIEACERVEKGAEKKILLQIREYNESLFLKLTNSAPAGQIQDATWKEDTQNHGLGMGNVRNIVEKYDGKISVAEMNGTYVTEIIL